MFYLDFYFASRINILVAKYVPAPIHMVDIIFPPSYITQRRALQCGAAATNGLARNPNIVIGVHK